MNEETIISVYCICSDFCRKMYPIENSRSKLSNGEVMSIGMLSALYFEGNISKARDFCIFSNLFSQMISREELTRILLPFPESFWVAMCSILARKAKNQYKKEYIIDSFPLPFCHLCRSKLCRLATGKEFLGYCASKKMYYFGMKAHLMVNKLGQLIELRLTPASIADVHALDFMEFKLPKNSILYGDKAYNCYWRESLLKRKNNIRVIPHRKKNMKRQHSVSDARNIKKHRKRVETAISRIIRKFPRAFHVRTFWGFIVRVILCSIASMLSPCGAIPR